jgi:aspartyl-tRNA synthetase
MRTNILETKDKVGESVEIFGWVNTRRDHGKIVFIDLRDRSGVVQVVFTPHQSGHGAGQAPGDEKMYETAQKLRSEWVLKIVGEVAKRPAEMVNKEIETGEIEIRPESLEVLAEAATPPFALDTDGHEIGEENRMKYRYLDLRRERMKNNLILRHRVIKFIRDFLDEAGFVEVETPILTKSTPEGARDYVVPSRLYPGKFYALPQSPQQYKQLLMVAGIEKYFQIARCFRDEDTRGDRQPEFTQLDLEMSFVTQENILSLVEKLYADMVKKLLPQKHITKIPFPRLTHEEAIKKYQSDKPDLRKDKNDPDELAFVWIVDFPMFEWKESEKRWDAVHHPFTSPKVEGDLPDFIAKTKRDPGGVLAHQYDFVLNGCEIAGGSIRIHQPELLSAVFEIMGHTAEQINKKFGHILEAFRYGVPPHGGIASGIDRFLAMASNEPSIREVIAFPKTGDARDLLMDSPTELEERQLKELHLKIIEK